MNTTNYERADTFGESNPILMRKTQDLVLAISKFLETDYENTSSWGQKRRLKKIKKMEGELWGTAYRTNPLQQGYGPNAKSYYISYIKGHL